MNDEELWEEVVKSLNKAETAEDALQVGVNIILSYMEAEGSVETLMSMKDFNLRIRIEQENTNEVSLTKH